MEKIYSVEAMISEKGKLYKGILDLFEDRCIFYNEKKTLINMGYDISEAEITFGKMKVSILNIYTKEKDFIQIKTNESTSDCFLLDEDRINEVIGCFNDKKQERIKSLGAEEIKENNTGIINEKNKKILSVFLENPYNNLGIASKSTKTEITEAFEKIKKLIRLEAISAYKTEFSLQGFPTPERDLALSQNAVTSLKNISNKWFWFDTTEGCKNWAKDNYRYELEQMEKSKVSYDMFLAQYLYGLIYDVKFKKSNVWNTIFAFYEDVVGENNTELLRSKLNKDESMKVTDSELLESFKDNILEPLTLLVDESQIEALLSLYRSIRMDRYKSMKNFKSLLAGKIIKWYNNQEKMIMDHIGDYLGEKKLSNDVVNTVLILAQRYDELVQHVFNDTLKAFTKEVVRADMVKSSYAKVMNSIMILLIVGNKKGDALKYANYAYLYVDNKAKKAIRDIFGVDNIDGAKDDISAHEMDTLGDDYYFGRNGKKQDYVQAVFWFKKAAELGENNSINSLGICYENGYGVEQDYEEAVYWYTKAANKNDKYALYNLSRAYFYGCGVTKNLPKAIQLAKKSINLGYEKGEKLLNDMMNEIQNNMIESSDFEDITFFEDDDICIDFCGLLFKEDHIEYRIWATNNSEIDIKLWMMDIKVNGKDYEDLEILTEVESGENDFYYGQIYAKNGISYYNINTIEFYIEIDNLSNETIADTDIVHIKCNTIRKIFSAIVCSDK